jgi:cell division transport system permease protein
MGACWQKKGAGLKPRKRVNRYTPQEDVKQDVAVRKMPAAQRSGRVGLIKRLHNYFALHFHVLTTTLAQLGRALTGNFMTVVVIGITLALPATLHVFLGKVESLGAAWQESAQISLFLQPNITAQSSTQLMNELKSWPEIGSLEYISPEQALDDFRKNSGLGDALAMLDDNPLPGVVVISPAMAHQDPANAELLLGSLRQRPEVDLAQLDLEWVQRLHGLIGLAERAVLVLGGLLALAVLFVIGNTIRLAIQSRHDEIEVVKLIGGSDAFVRRPFLYNGMWFGLFGGLLAWLLVNILLMILDGPVRQLAELYGSQFSLGLVDIKTTLLLLLLGPFLGLAGAWLVTGSRLRAIEPV